MLTWAICYFFASKYKAICNAISSERVTKITSHGLGVSIMLLFTSLMSDVAIFYFIACTIQGWPK